MPSSLVINTRMAALPLKRWSVETLERHRKRPPLACQRSKPTVRSVISKKSAVHSQQSKIRALTADCGLPTADWFLVTTYCLVLLAPPVRRHVLRLRVLPHRRPTTGSLLGDASTQLIIFPQVGQHFQGVPGGFFDLLTIVQDELEERIDHPLVAHLAEDLDRRPFDVDVLILQRLHDVVKCSLAKQLIERLQREPPHLPAGILQRLGENFRHFFARATQKPIHHILRQDNLQD